MDINRLTLSVVTLAICILLESIVGEGIFLHAIVLGTGFPHVILGLRYSRRGLSAAMNQMTSKLILLIAVPLGILAITYEWDLLALVFYFGLHHALAETYFEKVKPSVRDSWKRGLLVVSIFSSYLFATRADIGLSYAFNTTMLAISLTSSSIYLSLNRVKLFDKSKILGYLNNHSWAIIGPSLAIFAIWSPIDWKIIILYHFAFYGLLPLLKKDMVHGAKRKQFWIEGAVWNGLGLLFFLMLAVVAIKWNKPSVIYIPTQCFLALTYLHITWSFLISPANPEWIKRIVGPGAKTAV